MRQHSHAPLNVRPSGGGVELCVKAILFGWPLFGPLICSKLTCLPVGQEAVPGVNPYRGGLAESKKRQSKKLDPRFAKDARQVLAHTWVCGAGPPSHLPSLQNIGMFKT